MADSYVCSGVMMSCTIGTFHYGLQEAKIISEDAYQLIVFKNKFEQYRSPNYDQPRGAWIW